MRRSVGRYGSQADEAALERLIEKVEESTARANRALDDGLAAMAAGMARIERMEKQAARQIQVLLPTPRGATRKKLPRGQEVRRR